MLNVECSPRRPVQPRHDSTIPRHTTGHATPTPVQIMMMFMPIHMAVAMVMWFGALSSSLPAFVRTRDCLTLTLSRVVSLRLPCQAM